MYITTTMCDGVLHCLWFAPNVFLVSLHVAINVNVQYNGGFLPDIILCVDSISRTVTCTGELSALLFVVVVFSH